MASTITFTDTTGAATLVSSWPSPADRFGAWTPNAVPFGERANKLSDGQNHQFRFRTDYTATFEVRGIARTDVDIALRLIEHLYGDGNTCAVNTGDASSRSYATCCLAPGTDPELTLSDAGMIEYTLRLTLLNVAATPAQMLCEYA